MPQIAADQLLSPSARAVLDLQLPQVLVCESPYIVGRVGSRQLRALYKNQRLVGNRLAERPRELVQVSTVTCERA